MGKFSKTTLTEYARIFSGRDMSTVHEEISQALKDIASVRVHGDSKAATKGKVSVFVVPDRIKGTENFNVRVEVIGFDSPKAGKNLNPRSKDSSILGAKYLSQERLSKAFAADWQPAEEDKALISEQIKSIVAQIEEEYKG